MDREPLTITAAAAQIQNGELTPSVLLEQCLSRIDTYEPTVQAWAWLDRERARRDAVRLTDELQQGQSRGPLHGIPIGIKDIIDVSDMPTGCGSRLWANSYPKRDATCVARLRAAGAIILGKTVTTAYAYLDPPPTRNPWNRDRTPGGSSSGSAAAVACGMVLAALGTQTGGSITRPASYCGVYSLKPAWDWVPVEGVLPLAPSLDHVGVMANCVRDLLWVYRVIADKYTERFVTLELQDPSRWNGKISLTTDFFPTRTEPVMAERFAHLIERLNAVKPPIDIHMVTLPPSFNRIPAAHKAIMACEAAAYHEERIQAHPEDYPPRITELIREGLATSGAAFYRASQLRSELHKEFLNRRDYSGPLLVPAATGPAPTPETTGNAAMNAPWSYLGYPALSLPFDQTADGLPLACQLVGRSGYDSRLFAHAEQLEAVIGWEKRLPPLPNA